MSLLLDALNKADQERKRNEATPGINSNHEGLADQEARKNSMVLIVVILVSLVILLAAIYWLGQRSAVSAQASTDAKEPKPAQNLIASKPTSTIHSTTTSSPTQTQSPTETTNDSTEDSVADLYQQNVQTPARNATLTTAAIEPTTPEAAASTSNIEPTGATPTSIAQFANLPDLHDLPTQVMDKIPSLNYTEHNYNSIGGNVKLNGTIHHINDQLGNGLVIDKILSDGMILHIDNYSFKMKALNSWVNI
jgi:general secretion pathway protein B